MMIYSIGHSNAEIGAFLALLRRYDIQTLADTRSQPYSRYAPQFSRDALRNSLLENRIQYIFMGNSLGGRPDDASYYFSNGKVDYESLSRSPFYLSGIEQMLELATTGKVAFMCSEADFRKCHRYWLITRTLVSRGIEVSHILPSGELERTDPSEFEPVQPSLF